MEDFWRMMWEYQCGCIVMLCQLEEDGQVCATVYLFCEDNTTNECMYQQNDFFIVNGRGFGLNIETELNCILSLCQYCLVLSLATVLYLALIYWSL